MSFNNVSPGEAWKPEPAERYNAVNALLNNASNTVISPGGGLPNNIIMGYVPQDVTVSAYDPVFLEKLYSDKDPGFELLNGQCCMQISKESDNKPFGIALEEKLDKGTSAFIPIQVYGLAVMKSADYQGKWEVGDFASPVPASKGWTKQKKTNDPCGVVIAPPQATEKGYLGVISLPPLFKDYFSGTFKLVAIDKNSFKVVDGANPENPICGKILGNHPDFPLEVPTQTFSGNGQLWLVVHCDRSYNESDGTYSVKYSVKWSRSYNTDNPTIKPSMSYDFVQQRIGSFSDGVCYQVYKDGDLNLTNQGWYL